jgi:hypothetical protein
VKCNTSIAEQLLLLTQIKKAQSAGHDLNESDWRSRAGASEKQK